MRRKLVICFGLAVITLAVFWPVSRHEFINFDDPEYVTENPAVQDGITWPGVRWAFSSTHASNWHPLTWLSHMADCQVFGLRPGAHHLVSLGFHLASTLLLFLALSRMTGAVWRSALVAALFAWHPLRVESVAWAAERKDVLSAFFFLLTLWTYVRYVEAQSPQPPIASARRAPRNAPASSYLLSLLCFALGLMSKPMLVTLPCVLLLLDFWPLQRFRFPTLSAQGSTLLHLAREKVPFFVLALASGLVTLAAQRAGGAVTPLEQFPVGSRVANALAAYVAYLEKMIWPGSLSVFYPHSFFPAWQVCGCALLLAGVSLICVLQARARPYLLVGWCWFIGMLLPVIGLIQVGSQALADRYTYLPSIGFFLLLAWGANDLLRRSSARSAGLVWGVVVVLLSACLAGTRCQLKYWQNTRTLFTRALEVAPRNSVAHHALGATLAAQGEVAAAVTHYQAALAIDPAYDTVHINLGCILADQGRLQEARSHIEQVLARNPHHARAHRCLGNILFAQGNHAEAASQYELAWQFQPDVGDTIESLVKVWSPPAVPSALPGLRRILDLLPTADARARAAVAWAGQGKVAYAVQGYRAALALESQSPETLNNLAWLLATCPESGLRDGAEAVRLAEQACELTQYRRTVMVGTLAAAYAEAGRLADAVAAAQKACALATESGDEALARRNQQLLEQYRAGRPCREAANAPGPGSTKP